jgi:hypothetical protein
VDLFGLRYWNEILEWRGCFWGILDGGEGH